MRSINQKTWATVAAGVLASAGLAATANTADAVPTERYRNDPDRTAERSQTVTKQITMSPQRIRDYWTPQRMRAAKPAKGNFADPKTLRKKDGPELGKRSTLAKPALAKPAVAKAGVPAATPGTSPTTAGKVFFTLDGADYVCSGSVLNNPDKNLVITAGHCLHGGEGGNFASRVMFVPRYQDGKAPLGRWTALRLMALDGYTRNGDYRYDQAMFRVGRIRKIPLVNFTGGNGLSTGYSNRGQNVDIWGWPAEPPFDGEQAHHCKGTTLAVQDSTDAAVPCDMNGGASGGPWLHKMVNENVGSVYAETSRRTTSGTPYLLATPNHEGVRNMYWKMYTW